MKDSVRVALAQIPVTSLDRGANLQRVLDTCRRSAQEGADIVVFPELSDLGQVPEPDETFPAALLDAAQPITGEFVVSLGEVSKELGIHVAVGIAERHPSIPHTVYDSGLLIGPSGEVLGVQRKLHLAGAERHAFARGDSISVVPTALGIISVQICYDVYFPEVCRVAALQGAEILLGLFNVTDRPEWPGRLESLASVRAYENMQHVVLVNRVGSDHGRPFGGESAAAEPPGHVLASLPRGQESLEFVTLTAKALLEARSRRPVFADRRPEVYGDWGDGKAK